MEKRLGWKKDRYDKRDWIHPYRVAAVPDVFVDLTEYRPTVRDQGNEGSCVGHGIGGPLTGLLSKLGLVVTWFSPRWIYNGARYIEGELKYDEGCWPKDALDWLITKGGLPDPIWPYVAGKDTFTSPPSKYDSDAAKWPLASYSDVPQLGVGYYRVTNGADGICEAIAAGNFVSIGIPWPNSWMDSKDGVLSTIKASSAIAGGHEVFLYGYDKIKGIFYGQNSWGTSQWSYSGKVVPKGCFTMPFSVFEIFKQIGGYDAHYIKVNWGATPPPVPPGPTPVPTSQKIRIEGTMTVLV